MDIYLFNLREGDDARAPSFNRRLWTLGGRWYRAPRSGQWDWDLEAALQFGESRNTPLPTDRDDLDHFAHFQHLELGYSFPGRHQSRLAFEFDHATGDDDPDDGDNGRFDHLFGAAVGDLGTRGLYFALARTNLILAGTSLSWLMPLNLDGAVRVRGAWLATSRDFWFPAGLGNRADGADRYLGLQSELRLRWRPSDGPVELEGGFAHLAKGDFNDSPGIGPHDPDDTFYAYAEILLKF